MDASKSIEPVTVLKTHAAELIRRAREGGHPIVITQNGKATAVLVDAETYQRQREALTLLRLLAQGDQDDLRGRSLSHAAAKKRIAKKLKSLRGRG